LNICRMAWLPLLLHLPSSLIFLRPRIGVKSWKLDWARAESFTGFWVTSSLAFIFIKIGNLKICIWLLLRNVRHQVLGERNKKNSIHLLIWITCCPRTASALTGLSLSSWCCSGSPELRSPLFTLNSLSKLINDLTWRQIPRPHFFMS